MATVRLEAEMPDLGQTPWRALLAFVAVLHGRTSAAARLLPVEAERACRRAHDLCYGPDRRANGATYWLATRLGKCQSILIHYVVKHAGSYQR